MWEEILAEVHAVHRADAERQRRLAKRTGMTLSQWRVLREAIHGLSVARIARRLGLARQSVQKTADSLVESDFTRYVLNPDHARSPLLEPTETGRSRLLELERRAADAGHAELARQFEPEELETALEVMRAIRDGLETR